MTSNSPVDAALVPSGTYRFGNCRIDLAARELRRAGDLVVLSPKVFDCLAVLIEHSDRAVGRDELVATVWGKAEISDTLLGQTILKARRAIGDSASEQNAIRTIPRFGYAWVAAFTADDDTDPPARPAVDIAPPSPRRGSPRAVARAVALLLAIATVIGASHWFTTRAAPDAPPAAVPTDSAAVLPVEITAPAEWSWVRLGLMEAVASRLREGGQPVIPGDNVIALAHASATGRAEEAVLEATGARYAVLPSAAWSPAGWSVRLELRGQGTLRSADAHDADVLLAGRAASDRLLALLGRTPPPDSGGTQPWSDARLLQRADAAVLTDDLDGARRVLQAASPALRASPEFHLLLAKIDFRAGQFNAADDRLSALLAQTRAESDPLMRAKVLNGIGHVALRHGDATAAASAYAEAVALLENRSHPGELGQAYMGRGSAAQLQGRYDTALADFSQARVAFELAGDDLALARTEANEGLMDAARDRYAAAVAALESAIRRFERFGTLNEWAIATSAQIDAHLALLDPQSALVASDRAEPMRDRLPNPGIGHALSINRARALDASGRRQEAVALLQQVGRGADPKEEKSALAVARSELSRIELDSGHVHSAVELSVAALAAFEKGADTRDQLAAWMVATRALRAAGRTREAAERVTQLEAWARSAAPAPGQLYAQLAQAEQWASQNRRADAQAAYEHALGLATQGGVPADIAAVVISLGTWLITEGRLPEASAVVGQVARWADRDFNCAVLHLRLSVALAQRSLWQRALANALRLAGERRIPDDLATLPAAAAATQ